MNDAGIIAQTRNLELVYHRPGNSIKSLNGVDFQCQKGSCVALLGPNGAGKTSLLKCLIGLIHPTSGEVNLFGIPPGREAREKTGLAMENPGIYRKLTAREYLQYFAGFYRNKTIPDSLIDEWISRFQIPMGKRTTGELSLGERQKIHLARTLIHSPELLIWDEPTAHLDPAAQKSVLEILRKQIEKGVTIIFSTHQLETVENFASHYVFIDRGAIVFQGPANQLFGEKKHAVITVEKPLTGRDSEDFENFIISSFGPESKLVQERDKDFCHLKFGISGIEQKVPDLVSWLCSRQKRILEVVCIQPSLREVFHSRVMNK